MLRSTDDEQVEAEPRKDVELTLGPAMLFALVCSLLLVCGVCFGVGYTSGRRNGSQMAAAKAAASGKTLAEQAAAGLHKPAATGAPPVVQAASTASQASGTAPVTSASPAAQAGTPTVRPALVSPTLPAQANGSVAATPQVQTVLPSAAGIMVQIAAVSHMEDANVLMGALLKRGYAVTARHEPGDNLIHVQIGPFASRPEADAMSERLLNDGYNAVVMP